MSLKYLTLGVLIPLLGGFYYSRILSGIQRSARKRNARVVAFQTTGTDLLWPTEPDTLPLAWDGIDGWIGINDIAAVPYYERIAAASRPLVLVSSRLSVASCTVLPDNYGGALTAVRHLLDHGHTRIAFAGTLRQTDSRERHEAYVDALRERGIEPNQADFFAMSGNETLEGRDTGRAIVQSNMPFSALVTGTDKNALGILEELLAAGYRVPQDLAIVGFDDIEPSQYASPPLSTVRQRFDQLASVATDVLLAHLADGEPFPKAPLRVPTVFIRRQSCGCASSDRSVPPPVAAQEPLGARVEGLRRALVAQMTSDSTEVDVTENSWPGALGLATHFAALGRGDVGLSSAEVRECWRQLLTLVSDVETAERIAGMLEQAAVRWQVEDAGSQDASTSGKGWSKAQTDALAHHRVEMARAMRIVEQRRRRYYETIGEASRKINILLTGAELSHVQELTWLRWTPVRGAWLGLWEAPSGGRRRRLRIVSVFENASDNGAPPISLEPHYDTHTLPVRELAFARAAGVNDMVSVIPITGSGKNRGLLTVVGPIETELFDDLGSLGQWAALLSSALERESLLSSMSEGLERERHFAMTLRESEERYALAAKGANDGLWDWNLQNGMVYLSPRWGAILGYRELEIGTSAEYWFSKVHPDDVFALKAVVDEHLSGYRPHIEHEYRMAHADGGERWVLCRGVAVFDATGRPTRVAGSQTDITERKRAEEELRRSALHDALTGLPNRALLLDRLEQSIRRAERNPENRFAVMFLDLDRFKTINDSLGHLAGDELLVQIAFRLRECLRGTDTVARLGGDEFAIIVSETSGDEEAALVAERIHAALRAPFEIAAQRVFTSASIGITMSAPSRERAEDFLRDADTAMYRAKTQGRARHEVFDVRMHVQAMDRLRIETELRRGLERSEFLLYYQPLISVTTLAVIGFEALIRWKHPERGLLSPLTFLPVAEETGFIVPISEWVVGAACMHARVLKDVVGHAVRVSVNVPSQQLKTRQFVELVADSMSTAGISADSLGIELVESSLIENGETTDRVLQRIRKMGLYIAVDDFGTGYSSLSYLKRFPVHAIKIDRSFVLGIPSDPNDTAISSAILAMARSLRLSVVAEGVETREQIDFLSAQGCDAMQGFFFSRPLSDTDSVAFLAKPEPKLRPSQTPAARGDALGAK